jgi:transposase
MSVSQMSVGIDYHQSSVRVTVLGSDGKRYGSRDLSNSVESVIDFVSPYGAVKGVALEACTGSAHFADELRTKSGWNVELCHPGYVQRMRHNPDKTDASDSYLLADLHRVGYLPKVWLAPESLRDLRTLVRHRARCQEDIRDSKLRIRSILRRERIKTPPDIKDIWSKKKGMPWLKSLKCFLPETQWVFDDMLSQLECQLKRESAAVERLSAFSERDPLIQRLLKIKGVGLLTATALRAEVGTFTRFKTGKELSRFCGLTPRNASSGQRQADAGLIKAGNPVLRTSLVQVGHLLCRYHPDYRVYAQSLLGKGKHKCVIIAAVANRWLRKMFYDLRDFELGRA